jgi:ketosteroid isomerase-like protein|tara:strand:+ start:2154 stop:2558 length:405 start_codon:yes stop_codon:yes gene_type:complete
MSASDKDYIKSIIEDIEYGWENGDGAPFSKHFYDFEGAKYFESGGQNVGLQDLIKNHVEPEKDALYFLELNFLNIDIRVDEDFAWVTADTEVQGKVRRNDYEFDKTGHQTFILKRIDNSWKVLHTHSSSRDRKK